MSRRDDHAAERVRKRLLEWTKERGHGSRKELAEAVPAPFGETKSSSWVTDLLREGGGADLRLRDLDAVARLLDVPPGDLVRRNGDHYLEVTPTEMRLLRFHRALPEFTRHQVMGYFDYIYNLQQKVLETQASERDERTAEAKRQLARDQQTRKRPPA